MPARLKRGLENGGGVTQSEPQGRCGLGCLPEGAGRRVRTVRWKRKGGGESVVRMGFRDVDSPPSSSTMMTV